MRLVAPDQDLPSHLRHALRLYGRFSANVDRRLPPMDRPLSHRRVLAELLERPGQVDVGVAKSLGMDRSFLSKTVGALIREGLVSHVAGEFHRGQRHLTLTAGGQNLADQFLKEHREAVRAEFIALESEEQNQLMAVLSFRLTEEMPTRWRDVYINNSKHADYVWFLSRLILLEKNAVDEALTNGALAVGQSLKNHPDVDLRLTARLGEKPVGICLLSITENGTELDLGAMYVSPEARQLGIGSQLLERAISTATRHTYSKIHAVAGDGEVSLSHLLKKAGFERKRGGQRLIRYGTFQNVFNWVKSLPII